jgi:hypothetical protein
MNELKKLLENAGMAIKEDQMSWGDELVKELRYMLSDNLSANEFRSAIESLIEQYERTPEETFTTDDGREEPVSGRMSIDDNYGVGGLIDQGR